MNINLLRWVRLKWELYFDAIDNERLHLNFFITQIKMAVQKHMLCTVQFSSCWSWQLKPGYVIEIGQLIAAIFDLFCGEHRAHTNPHAQLLVSGDAFVLASPIDLKGQNSTLKINDTTNLDCDGCDARGMML